MTSHEFILQLIQSSLNSLGYSNVSQFLQQEIVSNNLQRNHTQLTVPERHQIDVINWFNSAVIDGNYGVIQSYVECTDFSADAPVGGKLNLPHRIPFSDLLAFRDESVVLVVIYLLKRWYWLELVLVHSNHSTKSFIIDYLKLELLPFLDKLPTPVTGLDKVFPRSLLSSLSRSAESDCLLSLAMDFPYDNQQTLNILSSQKYFYDIQLVFSSDDDLSPDHILRNNLISQFFNKIFKLSDKLSIYSTIYNIPTNYIHDIISQASTYQKLQNPYYLPPRTKLETLARLNDDEEPFMPRNQFSSVNEYFKCRYFSSKIIHNLTTNTNEVWCAKFSPSGKYLVTGSGDGKLMIYDVVDNFKFITQLESSPDEEKAVFSSGPKPSGNAKSIVHCCWDPREEYIVSCCFDTMVRVWYVGGLKNPESNKRRSSRFSNEPKGYKLMSCFTLGDSIRIWSCAFLPDAPNYDPRFVLGSPDKVLKLYDIHGTELFDFHGNIYETNFHEDTTTDDVNMQEADSDDEQNANEEANSDANEFEQKKASKIKEDKSIDKQLLSYFNRIVDVAISPNGKILITIDRNKQLQFFAIPEHFDQDATTTRILSITLRSCGTSCTISKNGKYLLLSIGPEELQVWDISGLTEFASENYEMPILYRKFYAHNHGDCTIRSSFGYLVEDSNEEELVLSGSHDGFVYVWKLHTGQIITRLNAHEGTCNMVDWNLSGPNSTKKNGRDYGKLWCSVGDDKNVKIWGPSDWE